LFPSYSHKVLPEKTKCYPAETCIKITESEAVIELQGLLNHNISRLLMSLQDSRNLMIADHLTLYLKWGLDGSSGHERFKQMFKDRDSCDSTVFITSIVPVILENKEGRIVWENSTPNSTRYGKQTVNNIEYLY